MISDAIPVAFASLLKGRFYIRRSSSIIHPDFDLPCGGVLEPELGFWENSKGSKVVWTWFFGGDGISSMAASGVSSRSFWSNSTFSISILGGD